MKILLWPTQYPPTIGGLEIMVHSLAMQLKKKGHELLVICNGEEEKKYFMDQINVWTFPFVKALLHSDLAAIKRIFEHIHQLFDDFSPDLVNIHGWFESFCFYQVRILDKKKIPFCVTIHGLLEQKNYKTKACLQLWSMANAINTVSKAILDSLKELEMSHSSWRVIYNGLPTPSSPLQPLPIDSPKLAMGGRLTEEKCFDVGFHAMKILVKTRPRLKLCLVGGGAKYQELLRLKKELQLDEYIEMTDFIQPHKVYSYIDEASLVLIPSYYESFCLVALQAALRGRPVIASNVYGLKEVVEPFRTGLLVEPNNPAALAKAVNDLLAAPVVMEQMGQAGYQRALEHFTIEKTTENYLNMYQEILRE